MKQQLLGILSRMHDWYVFPPQVRQDYYPDFREAIHELVGEGHVERTQIDGQTYFRLRSPGRPPESTVREPLTDCEVKQPCIT